jgi:cytochrome c peroxidase
MMRVLMAIVLAIPLGLDLYMPAPEDNPITVDKIRLGRRLFNDRRLSRDQSLSCASCHDPKRAFSTAKPLSVGVFGRVGRRNVPAILNRGYGRAFFWDARITSLEEQVLRPIQDPNEMDMTLAEASARARLPAEEISRALASYVRSILSGNAPFDRFVNGDRKALSPEQQAGLQIFRGKGNCTACHVGPNFSDERLHNTGIAWRPSTGSGPGQAPAGSGQGSYQDEGRFAVSGKPEDRGAFKTPTLREVARTSPYMHDGSKATLEEVVKFYDEGGRPNPAIDPEIHPLHLTVEQKAALVAFLKSLSGTLREGR